MAAVEYFLKLDGIEGESTDAKHKGELVLDSFGWGVSQSGVGAGGAGGGGGGGAGKAQFQDFVFVQRTSKASPKLFLACVTGQHLKTAVLTARRSGKNPLEFLTITLGDVLVASFQETGVAGEVPLETVSLAFARLEIAYRPQSATGKPAPALKAGFDLKLNKPV
ncbi:MAG: type VI secretion system tube protein Hcp [Actinobacteria bacterium]|nr:type VI secretion system tube protein Hcp [Actinomycetota bacterium]